MKEYIKPVIVFLLHKLSKAVLDKYKPHIVAITGTVGKTSTKDAVYSALSRLESTRRSQKSFNSEIGVPLTILGMPNPAKDIWGWVRVLLEGVALRVLPNHYPKWLVLEVGTDRPGDIAEITKWLKPDITIITKLSKVPVHVEAFGDPKYVFEEKGNLVKALKPGGTLILNADDADVMEYKNLVDNKCLTFGWSKSADVSAKNYKVSYSEDKKPVGISFDVVINDSKEVLPIAINGTLGEQHVQHVLASICVVISLGEDPNLVARSFENELSLPGRMRLVDGVNESVILDDTYNSSPVAVEEALKTLHSTKLSSRAGRRIAILGDMLELGRYAAEAHKEVGRMSSEIVDILVTVGVRSRYTAETALSLGLNPENVFQLNDSREVGKFVRGLTKKGDLILIKGSQGMRMERATKDLMLHPEDAEKLLVRHDKEWQERA